MALPLNKITAQRQMANHHAVERQETRAAQITRRMAELRKMAPAVLVGMEQTRLDPITRAALTYLIREAR